MKRRTDYQTIAFTAVLSMALTVPLAGQAVSTPEATEPPPATEAPPIADEDEEVIVLSPFEVSASDTEGYRAATTLAGNRLNTELRDIGSAVQVVTAEFLRDTGATGNDTLLQYTTSTEVGSVHGNFAGVGDGPVPDESRLFTTPNQNTRVRGLTNADNTRDYFLSNIPWDSYNVDRVDLQRGPNSILFGQGSPAGLINNSTKPASFANSGEIEVRVDNYGTFRTSLDLNRELIPDELAVRIALLRDDTKYKQDPAYQLSERGFAALRWEPGFLKKGSARTIIKANFESGSVESNRPRTLPPNDLITPWFETGTYEGSFTQAYTQVIPGTYSASQVGDPRTFNNLNRALFNPQHVQNDNFYRPGFGLTRPGINGGPWRGRPNPSFNPWIGNFGQSFEGSVAFHQDDGGAPVYWNPEVKETFGIGTTGAVDGTLGYDFHRLVGLNNYSQFAKAAGLPYGQLGVYKDRALTDDSVFDFYSNLIDGPNKREWQDFNAFNINVAQTFFNDKMGVELAYNFEDYENGQLSLLTDYRQGIYIDMNAVYTDGTNTGTGTAPDNVPFADGTPNPNVGRPFVADSGMNGNNSYESNRRVKRMTAFFMHDFDREGETSNWLTRLLGKHVLTGVLADDEQRTDYRQWMRYAIDDQSYRDFFGFDTNRFNDNRFSITQAIYLGDSLIGRESASGANIPRIQNVISVPNGTMRAFNSRWDNPAGVNPTDVWYNDLYVAPQYEYAAPWNPPYDPENPNATDSSGALLWQDRRLSTQSENPLNYVGWEDIPVNIVDSETMEGGRDYLTTSVNINRSLTTTQALVWQSHWWDNALVGTYGLRRDRAQGWTTSFNTDNGVRGNDGHLVLNDDTLSLPETGTPNLYSDVWKTSKSWMVVAHFNQFPVVGPLVEKLPVTISAYYNDSSNFEPEALRVDILAQPIPLPQGKTKDYGLMFSTKDGKYSLRVNHYKTVSTNQQSTGLNRAYFIGQSQAYGANWVNQYEYDFAVSNQPWSSTAFHMASNRPADAPLPPGWTRAEIDAATVDNPAYDPTNSLQNYGTGGRAGDTTASAAAWERSVIEAWRGWQATVEQDFPGFNEAWGIDMNAPWRHDESAAYGVTSSQPPGFQLTEDSTSEGYEIELTAQPTRNWRVAVNAAKTKAIRNNIGGVNLAAFVAGYEDFLQGPGGDLRIWWGGAGNETSLYQWNLNIGSEWAQRALQEGTNVPELREWRVNAITNYDFTEGFLRGVNVGMGVRYQSAVVIGYPVIQEDPTIEAFTFDLGSPYEGPAETDFDFWVGYQKRLAEKVDWRIQLNIRNAFTSDELIPVTVQPDGSAAGYRIAPPRTLTLTNTFRF